MNVQYKHLNVRFTDFRYTIAVNVPTKEELLTAAMDIMENGLVPFDIGVGMSRVHPTDQYCKAIGREICLNRMIEIPFDLKAIVNEPNKTHYSFVGDVVVAENDENATTVGIVFSVVPHSSHVKLEHVVVYNVD